MNTDRDDMYEAGIYLAQRFCAVNEIPMPTMQRLKSGDQLYHLATCGFYRPTTIHIMVEKCAQKGYGGRAWSWPAYAIDRTPYGVIQHELGHHVDNHFSVVRDGKAERLFSREIYEQSKEKPLTGYLGHYANYQEIHFFMEWFAENFRLFVTNPNLSQLLRPKFYAAMLGAGLSPVVTEPSPLQVLSVVPWETVLKDQQATPRIIEQARKKISNTSAPGPTRKIENTKGSDTLSLPLT